MTEMLAHFSPADGWKCPRPRWIRPWTRQAGVGPATDAHLEPEVEAWFEAAVAQADSEHPPTRGSYEYRRERAKRPDLKS